MADLRSILAPQIDDTALATRLREIAADLPVPVLWLIGKPQSGKSSIVRALTGDDRAEIGSGFRACTRTAAIYDFPAPDDPLLRFLDTRGLGEPGYDPAADLAASGQQAHALVVVVKALDQALEPLAELVARIHRQQPGRTTLVVQTCLHEAYGHPSTPHPLPYPYDGEGRPNAAVAAGLARALARQRQVLRAHLGGAALRFVPVDLTLPGDGFDPPTYGLDALWAALEEALPRTLLHVARETVAVRRTIGDELARAAHPHVVACAVAAGAAASVPIPLVDIPLVTLVQARMCTALATLYGQPSGARALAELASSLGLGLLGTLGRRELVKLIPFWGSAVAASFTAASTYALGRTLCAYFEHVGRGGAPDPALFRDLYARQLDEGRRLVGTALPRLLGGGTGPRPGGPA